jgi:anion-transporting  ArsA/GET3 family ATPase
VAGKPQFLFFGGKGGAGKTTCAAARATIEAAAGARVLVVSTDPAHSLGDALAVRLSSAPRAVHRTSSRAAPPAGRTRRNSRSRGSLHAIELDARRAFGRWLARQRSALGDVIEHGTWLDRTDIDALLDLPLPGIDELLGLAEIVRLARVEPEMSSAGGRHPSAPSPGSAPRYDLIVVDTAPTGHTLRLLASPEAVAAVAAALDELQQEHRIVRQRFARRARPEAADHVIAMLAGPARRIAALIVVDMAPTGHALRLLEQPAAAREWVQALLRVLLKYRALARPGRLARELVTLSKSIRDLQGLLRDATRTHVVVVTRAADLPRLETERLMSDLRRLEMAIPAIVVNALTLGPGRCSRCRATAAAERLQVATLRRDLPRSRQCVIIQTPLSAPPPRGIATLEQWATLWMCDQLSQSVPRRRGGRRE